MRRKSVTPRELKVLRKAKTDTLGAASRAAVSLMGPSPLLSPREEAGAGEVPEAATTSCWWSMPAEGDGSPVSLLASLALGSRDGSVVMNSDYSLTIPGAMESKVKRCLLSRVPQDR